MSLPPITFATDTELRDAAFAAKLARRRRLLMRISIPIAIIAALVSLKLLSAVGLNLIGTASYDRANYSTAADRYVNTQFLNVVQPWKAYYNEGTAHYSAGKFFTASGRFAIALDKVPKAPEGEPRGTDECMVRVNYSLALEGTADETLAVGDAAMAEKYYAEALDMLADCADSGAGGETAEEAQDRQEQSQHEAQRQQEENQQGGGEGESPEGEDPDAGGESSEDGHGGEEEEPADVDPQQQELEERNQRANEEQTKDGESGLGGGEGSGQNW